MNLGDRWDAIPTWKKYLSLFLVVLNFLLIEGAILYEFSDVRNRAFIAWVRTFLILTIFIGLVGAFILAVYLIDVWDFVKKKDRSSETFPSKATWAAVVIGIVMVASVYPSLIIVEQRGDKPPELLILGHTGKYGVPDMAVVFWTEKETQNYIEWGLSSDNMSTRIEESIKANSHCFFLKDLQRGTTYFYRINGEDTIYNFTTWSGSDLHIAVSSDTHIGAGTNNVSDTQKILENIYYSSKPYDALFHLGDLVEYGFEDEEYADFISLFSPYTTHIPFRPVIGNHDTLFHGERLWKDYFYPEQIEGDSGSPYWFRVDFGDSIHFIFLDLEWGTETYSAEQREWLETQLNSIDPDDWIIVLNHAYYYASSYVIDGKAWYDNPDMINTFSDLYAEHGVDIVISGHDHQMEHLRNKGVDYFIVGAFGGVLDENYTTRGEGSLWYDNTHHGYIDLTFDGRGTYAQVIFKDPYDNVLYSTNVTRA